MNEAILMSKAIVMGARLRLRKEAFKDLKARDWQFSGVEKGKLVLWRPEGFILRAKLEDIDWEDHNKPKIED
jgi:hypothetical protein